MTEKQRLKHVEQAREKNLVGGVATLIGSDRDIFMEGFREPKAPPRLSWLNAKTHAGFAGRKNRPGRKEEHAEALIVRTEKELADARELVADLKARLKNDTGQDLPDHQQEDRGVETGTGQPELGS